MIQSPAGLRTTDGYPIQQERCGANPTRATAPKRKRQVTLIGFYGRGNFGDDLMCSALTRFVAENSSLKVRIISSNPAVQRDLAGANVEVLPRKLSVLLQSLADSDILCQGGGTIFHDSYTGRLLVRYWTKLCMWATFFWVARFRGARVVIVGAGVGPLRHGISRSISRVAFSACSSIGVRDQTSADTIKRLSRRSRCELGFDLAALGSQALPTTRENARTSPKVLAISACSLSEFTRDVNINPEYWFALADALAIFHKEQPIRVNFFSLFTGGFSGSDETIADLIAGRLPPDLSMERRSYDGRVEDFWKEFVSCDWFLCARFHAALAAFLCGGNLAVISYNRKVSDLADEIGLTSARRVSAEAPQPISVWLQLLRSFNGSVPASALLDRKQAVARAERAVCRVFEAAGASVSRPHPRP
jgi:polysaccharide pyruvyl transferase WcaK-like protein